MPGSIVGYVVSLQLCRVNFSGMLIPTNKPKTEAFRASEGLNASRIQDMDNLRPVFLPQIMISALYSADFRFRVKAGVIDLVTLQPVPQGITAYAQKLGGQDLILGALFHRHV